MSNRGVKFSAGVHLPDERLASLRRLNAQDAEAVSTLYRNLTDHDRYFRFFTRFFTLNVNGLDLLATKLTEPGINQYAVGAFEDDRLIGVANHWPAMTRAPLKSRSWSHMTTSCVAWERPYSYIWPVSLAPTEYGALSPTLCLRITPCSTFYSIWTGRVRDWTTD